VKRFALALLLGVLGCREASDRDALVERAAFGVFFGGQIQDRTELVFELDESKQRTGIRIDFRAPLSRPVAVAWEIARPMSDKVSRAGDAGPDQQVVEVGQVRARVGEKRLDVPISLRRGQVLGTWHVRVTVDDRRLIDRDVLVIAAREFREREADAGH